MHHATFVHDENDTKIIKSVKITQAYSIYVDGHVFLWSTV